MDRRLYRVIVTLPEKNVITLEHLNKEQAEGAVEALKHAGAGWTSLDRPGGKKMHINRAHILLIVMEVE